MSEVFTRIGMGMVGVAISCAAFWLGLTHRGVVSSEDDPIPECRDHHLAPEIAALVRPVLIASQSWTWEPEYDALEVMLADTSARSLEARVALSAYYLGAHPGEELHESLLSQYQDATPLVRRYMECRPPMEREWLIGTLIAGRGGYRAYFELLGEGRLTTR